MPLSCCSNTLPYLQALTQDKMRSAASAEMAIATESLGESELTDDDFVSLGASPRASQAEACSEPSFSMRHDLPQVPAVLSSSLCSAEALLGLHRVSCLQCSSEFVTRLLVLSCICRCWSGFIQHWTQQAGLHVLQASTTQHIGLILRQP